MSTLRMALMRGGDSALDLVPRLLGSRSSSHAKFANPTKIKDVKQANVMIERWEDIGETLKQAMIRLIRRAC